MPSPDFRREVQRIEERIEEGLNRLGSHFDKDSRSKNYPISTWIGAGYRTDPLQLVSKTWLRDIPILDQGSLGSGTGNAGTGMVGCSPLFDRETIRFKNLVLDENFAVNLYERATRLDGLGQPYYPPNDRGSSTLGVLKALKQIGFIDQYRWGFGLVDVLNAISLVGAGITGVLWYEGFDNPDPTTGELTISGNVRGGHELVLHGIDVDKRLVWGDNSWGSGWDQSGRFCWSWDTLDRLLQDQGEFGVGVWR